MRCVLLPPLAPRRRSVSRCASRVRCRAGPPTATRTHTHTGDDNDAVHRCGTEVYGIALDCDADALRFVVEQHGAPPAFCHRATRTCWGDTPGVDGIGALERTLAARRRDAPAGSYTKRLFDDPALLRNKVTTVGRGAAIGRVPPARRRRGSGVLHWDPFDRRVDRRGWCEGVCDALGRKEAPSSLDHSGRA